jgi:hypothetical protein
MPLVIKKENRGSASRCIQCRQNSNVRHETINRSTPEFYRQMRSFFRDDKFSYNSAYKYSVNCSFQWCNLSHYIPNLQRVEIDLRHVGFFGFSIKFGAF